MSDVKLKFENLYQSLLEELPEILPGKQFPSVRELMKRYGVGQMTVFMAVSKLREEGYLVQIPGKGVFTTEKVGKLNVANEPTLMVAVPRWVASDIVELAQTLEELRPAYPDHRLLLHYFDASYIIPPQLPLFEENVTGLVILPSSGMFGINEVKSLLEYDIPLVVWGWHLDMFGMLSVGTDDLFSGNLAAHYLYQRGHRKIGILISEPHDCIIMERVKGVLDYAELQGMEVQVIDCEVIRGEVGSQKANYKFSQVIEAGLSITALIGVCGESLQGAINACNRNGVRIPQDLGIISIGGEKITETYFPPITTEDIDCRDQIKVALDMVSKPESDKQNSCYFRPSIIERNSVLDLNSK